MNDTGVNMECFNEVNSLTIDELWMHGTLEIYHGGVFPDSDSFCGRCWLKLRNDVPMERIIDWKLLEDDIKDLLTALDHYKADKNHKDYVFLTQKLREAVIYNRAELNSDFSYSDVEITVLAMSAKGNRLTIPQDLFLTNYKEIKALLKNFGGSYKSSKGAKYFEFDFEASLVLDRIRNKESSNLKKDFQWYATSEKLADELCAMTFDPYLNKSVKVLEPSAGQGAILSSIENWFKTNAINIELDPKNFYAVEFMKENFSILEKSWNINLTCGDFLEYDEFINYYDYIIANPPFSNGQDIKHVQHMYKLLKPGGTLTSVMSVSWLFNTQKKFKSFRKWLGIDDSKMNDLKLASRGGSSYEGSRFSEHGNIENIKIKTLESGTFKESGTDVITCIVQITKNDISGFSLPPVRIAEQQLFESTGQLSIF